MTFFLLGGLAMDKNLIKQVFSRAEAIITNDHFVYAKKSDGWYHGSDYVNKDAIYPFTRSVRYLCKVISMHFQGIGPEVIVGPTVGGVILSQWIAAYLSFRKGTNEQVLSLFADEEKDDKGNSYRIIKRGYNKHVKGRKCLVVEDVINSGLTVQKTIKAVEIANGLVIGVSALCNRSGGKVTAETLGVPKLFSLLDLDMKMYKEEDCPICRERGVKSVRTDLGKGREFLIRIGQY